MKTISDDLFRVVKSLTGSEKGNFKKYTTKNTPGKKNNYLVLFEAVDSSILENEYIAFNAGSLTKSIKMKVQDYIKIANPFVISFSSIKSSTN